MSGVRCKARAKRYRHIARILAVTSICVPGCADALPFCALGHTRCSNNRATGVGMKRVRYVHALRELFGLEAEPAASQEAPSAEVTRLDARRPRP